VGVGCDGDDGTEVRTVWDGGSGEEEEEEEEGKFWVETRSSAIGRKRRAASSTEGLAAGSVTHMASTKRFKDWGGWWHLNCCCCCLFSLSFESLAVVLRERKLSVFGKSGRRPLESLRKI
jgi:hypothetical protein